jgi:amino acid transporter
VRAIGRWSLTALVVNSILGSAVFGLPSVMAGLLGRLSLWAYVIAALVTLLTVACYAEVASRFTEAGAAYLYTRHAFGSFLGIQVAWVSWLVRISAAAANANIFTQYLAELFPASNSGAVRIAILTALLGMLAAVNYRGVRSGTQLSNVFTAAKLVPLLIFVIAGAAYLALHHEGLVRSAPVSATGADWLQAVLLLAFAYGGFDGALMPMAEARNPRRDAPFALFTALALLTALYIAVQMIVQAVLPEPTASTRPLAAAARVFLGNGGAVLMTVGAMLSVYGYLSAQTLNTPRLTYALAEHREFPPAFAAVHERFRTPYISIIAFATAVWMLAVVGDFRWNATLSAISRLFSYGAVCAALPVLRRKAAPPAAFQLPAGDLIASLAVLFSILLLTRMGKLELYFMLATALLALGTWWWARGRRS